MKDPTVERFFGALQYRPRRVPGVVAGTTLDANGKPTYCTVAANGSIVRVAMSPTDQMLPGGTAVTLEQSGADASADYRIVGVHGAYTVNSGLFNLPDAITLSGQAYAGGDMVIGGLTGGNLWAEFATGNMHSRVANAIYALDAASAPTIDGTAYAAGTKVIGALTRTAESTYTATGTRLLLASTKIDLGSGTDTRVLLNADGSGSLGDGGISWDAAGAMALNTLSVAGTLTMGIGSQLKSAGYSAGVSGYSLNADGSAEFENVMVRGTLRTVVFEKSLVTALAGSQIVAKSAAALYADATIADPTFTLDVTLQAGAAPFANNDILRIKDGAVDTWVTVDAGTDQTTFWRYTATYQSGTNSGTVRAGEAIVDYGQSGQGYYIVSADGLLGASAAWALRSHAGAPWTTETTHVYAGTDGRLYAGSGNVHLDGDGLALGASYAAVGGPYDAGSYLDFIGTPGSAIDGHLITRIASGFNNGLGTVWFTIKAMKPDTAVYRELIIDELQGLSFLSADATYGPARFGDTTVEDLTSGSITNSGQIHSDGSISTDLNLSGDKAFLDGASATGASLVSSGVLHVTGNNHTPTGGEGLELYYQSGTASLLGYDRANSHFTPLAHYGSYNLLTLPNSDPGTVGWCDNGAGLGSVMLWVDTALGRLHFRVRYPAGGYVDGQVALA